MKETEILYHMRSIMNTLDLLYEQRLDSADLSLSVSGARDHIRLAIQYLEG